MSENNRSSRKPFLLKPTGKDYLWGGKRLREEFAKDIDMYPLAETWECSTHPNGPSYVGIGNFEGMSLAEVLNEHPDYLGAHPGSISAFHGETGLAKPELPVLVKLIDADRDLSVQVHPSDEYAHTYENGQSGKTEMWYVLDAAPGAKLVYGLNANLDKEYVRKAVSEGNLGRYLQKIPVKKNDIFFITPGTIHAIGAGVLVAEIQQNSDLTYRLYDYDRTDKLGNKRELHIEKALEVANLKSSAEPSQPLRVLKYKPGVASELLGRCKYFQVYRLLVNTERRNKVWFRADEMSFRVLLCINGCGIMNYGEEVQEIYKGDCFFIPADSIDIRLHGRMELLDVRG